MCQQINCKATYDRMLKLENNYKHASVGDEKRFYFNVAIAVVSNYINNPDYEHSSEIDGLLINSKFYLDVVKVLKYSNNADNLEDKVHVILNRKLNAMEREFKEIRRLLKKII